MIDHGTKREMDYQIVGFSLLDMVTIVGMALFSFYVTLHYFKMKEFDDRLACVHAAHVMNHNPDVCLKGTVR